MIDQEEADNGQVEPGTGPAERENEPTEAVLLAVLKKDACREDLLQVLGEIIGMAGHKAARGRFKNPTAEQVRIRYLTLVKDTCLAYNAVKKDQELEDMERVLKSLEAARNAA